MTKHTKHKWFLALLGVVAAALASTASAQAAYLVLGTTNTSNAQTSLKGSTDGPELNIINTHGNRPGIKAEGGSFGLYGQSSSTNTTGVRGVSNTGPYASGVSGTTSTGAGVYGFSSGGTGQGVSGQSAALNGTGVIGTANNGASAHGVFGFSQSGSGVFGFGLQYGGSFLGKTGVQGVSSALNSAGVKGVANSGVVAHGVEGQSSSGSGVFGQSTGTGTNGVFGVADNGTGVRGSSANGYGVVGLSTNGFGVYGESANSEAGDFVGHVTITGGCSGCTGPSSLKIDDPLDPAHKYLQHAGVASSEQLDLYSGNAVTDRRGFATVHLPRWFQALNSSFRYQLTSLSGLQEVAVAREIEHNRFTIQSEKPNSRISWQVTGVRHDPYANAHRSRVEVRKSAGEQGKYLHPELYGKSNRDTIGHVNVIRIPPAIQKR